MAKIITTKSRRRRGGKVRKAARRAARTVIVQTKKAYRRAKGINVTKKDVIVSVAAGGAGAIGSSLILAKTTDLQAKIPGGSLTMNAAIAAAGGWLTYKGVKKRNMAVTGLGMGMAAAAAGSVISSIMSKTGATVAAPFVNPSLAAPIRVRPAALNAPFVRPSVAVRSIKDEEYI